MIGFGTIDPLVGKVLPRFVLGWYSGGGGPGGGGAGSRGGGALILEASSGIFASGVITMKGGAGTGGDGGPGQRGGDRGNCGGYGGSGGVAAIRQSSAGGVGGARDPVCSRSSAGGPGGAGGNGAGGGVCLICNGPFGIQVSGTIDTRGGGDDQENCGSIKLVGVKGRIDISSATILGGWNDVFGTPLKLENRNCIHVC